MAHPSFSTRHPHRRTSGYDPQYSWDPRWGCFQVPTISTRPYSMMSHQHPELVTSHQSSSSMKEPSGWTGQHRPIPISQMHLGSKHNLTRTPSMRTTEEFHPSYPPHTSQNIYSGYEGARRPNIHETNYSVPGANDKTPPLPCHDAGAFAFSSRHRKPERATNMDTGYNVPGAYPSSPCASSVCQEAFPQKHHQEQLPKKSRKSRHDACQSPTPGRPIYTGSSRRAKYSPRKEKFTSGNDIPPVNSVHPSPRSTPVSEPFHGNERNSHPGTKHRRPTPTKRSRGDRTSESEHPSGGYATPPTTPQIPSHRSKPHARSSHESQEEAGTKAGRFSDRSRDTQELMTSQTMTLGPGQPKPRWTERYGTNKTMPKSEYGVWNPNHAKFLASQPIPVSPLNADYIKQKCIFCEEQKRDVSYFVPMCYVQETVKRSRGMQSRVIEEWVVTREPVINKVACQDCYQQVKVWKAAFLVMRIAAEARWRR